jgi:glycosyltransferase involved in cell wall biosynthesis
LSASRPELSVVLPCRNQADHIARVVESYFAPLDAAGRAYELVVVPNGCTDDTVAVVRALATRHPRVTVVESAGGWGLSVAAGVHASAGRLVCYTNSARTDPANIPPLVDLHERTGSCVAKVRRVHRGNATREIGSWLYNLEGRLLYGFEAYDVNGTPKVLSRELFDRLAPRSPGDLLDMELLAKAKRLGVPVLEMVVEGFSRHGGTSSTNLKSAWRMYTGALGLRREIARVDGR